MKHSVIIICLLVLPLGATAQQPPPGSMPVPPPQAPAQMDPRQTVQQGVDRLQAFIQSNPNLNPAMVSGFLQKEIAEYFDFEAMARLVLGPLDFSLDEKQRRDVRLMIRDQFLAALGNNLSAYRGGNVGIVNVNGNLSAGRVNVRLGIYRPGQYPMLVELRIARGPLGWKIYDVAANGVSAVAHYRNYIQSVLLRAGPQGLLPTGQ